MNLDSCIGLGGRLSSRNDHSASNKYTNKNFFEGKNYESILECLDGGYGIAMNIIRQLRELRDLVNRFADGLTSYSDKWKSEINEQSSLSSYHTTKNAQLLTAEGPEKHAKELKDVCRAIETVMVDYKKQINEMYPRLYFSTTHKHIQTEKMRKLFKTARLPLKTTLEELEQLSTKKKQINDCLSTANKEYENLKIDSTTSKNKLTQAHEKVIQQTNELRLIERSIKLAKKTLIDRKKAYREQATKIFRQCQILEKQRLDQIKETLIKFNQAISLSEYCSKLGLIYQQLISNINNEQNSQSDLDHWAQIYGIHKPDSPSINDSEGADDSDSGIVSTTTD